MLKTRKVVIIGAGHVGSHVALSLIYSGEANEIVLIDILPEKAFAQALDLNDAIAGVAKDVKVRSGSYDELADADIMVMAFGRSRRPGETRLDMFDDSIRMARDIIPKVKAADFKGIMISISNPADIICEYIRRNLDLPRERAICTGTSLETFRLQRIIGRITGYNRHNVQGFCMGEHGNSNKTIFSKISISGKPFLELIKEKPELMDSLTLEDIETELKVTGSIEIDGKGCTEFGIGLVANKLITAIFHDQKIVWPISVALEGEYGQKDVAAGVPCVIGKNGFEGVVEVELTAEEKAAFDASCDIIRGFLLRADDVK